MSVMECPVTQFHEIPKYHNSISSLPKLPEENSSKIHESLAYLDNRAPRCATRFVSLGSSDKLKNLFSNSKKGNVISN